MMVIPRKHIFILILAALSSCCFSDESETAEEMFLKDDKDFKHYITEGLEMTRKERNWPSGHIFYYSKNSEYYSQMAEESEDFLMFDKSEAGKAVQESLVAPSQTLALDASRLITAGEEVKGLPNPTELRPREDEDEATVDVTPSGSAALATTGSQEIALVDHQRSLILTESMTHGTMSEAGALVENPEEWNKQFHKKRTFRYGCEEGGFCEGDSNWVLAMKGLEANATKLSRTGNLSAMLPSTGSEEAQWEWFTQAGGKMTFARIEKGALGRATLMATEDVAQGEVTAQHTHSTAHA
jgi:hypothetical protein